MPQNKRVVTDSETEARFRAYLAQVPAYLLDPPDESWIRWICPEPDQRAVFRVLHTRFGVNDQAQRLTNPPDPARGLVRPWVAISFQEIANKMLLTVPRVKKAVTQLVAKGFIEVSHLPEGGKQVPHFQWSWEQVLQAVIAAVNGKDAGNRVVEEIRSKPQTDQARPKRTRRKKSE